MLQQNTRRRVGEGGESIEQPNSLCSSAQVNIRNGEQVLAVEEYRIMKRNLITALMAIAILGLAQLVPKPATALWDPSDTTWTYVTANVVGEAVELHYPNGGPADEPDAGAMLAIASMSGEVTSGSASVSGQLERHYTYSGSGYPLDLEVGCIISAGARARSLSSGTPTITAAAAAVATPSGAHLGGTYTMQYSPSPSVAAPWGGAWAIDEPDSIADVFDGLLYDSATVSVALHVDAQDFADVLADAVAAAHAGVSYTP